LYATFSPTEINAAMIGETMVVTETDVLQEAKPLRKEDLPEYKKCPSERSVNLSEQGCE